MKLIESVDDQEPTLTTPTSSDNNSIEVNTTPRSEGISDTDDTQESDDEEASSGLGWVADKTIEVDISLEG